MSRARVVYQDWIVNLGYDPSGPRPDQLSPTEYNSNIIAAVNDALTGLDREEAAFIRLFYYQGKGYREIGEISRREIYRLEALHRRALRKLKTRLTASLAETVPLPTCTPPACVLCRHPDREKIDRLIVSKPDTETWKPIIDILKQEFGIKIGTPQCLIGHKKYHIL